MTKRIGRYEVLAELGHGGFGRVFRGLDPTVGRQVAIKTLIADDDAGMLTRFRNEAAASGRLRHPNIVTIYDFGEQDKVPYIVMELLEGRDLQYAIEDPARMPLSLLQKIQIMTQIAAGLGHAHASGIIHRDVKPANIMRLNDGTVKIMDFGIALVTQGTQSRVTPRGAMIGTFRYMAPEQFKGAEPDARSDIFSYGLIFYELLAGVHPFHAADAAALMYNILSIEPVPIGDVCPDIPPELQAVVTRILLKDPDLRYQSLDDVLFDMQPALLVLRTARARELTEEAKSAKEQNQFEAAQGLVRQALELAPGYEDARHLREELQAELRRQAIRPRVESLLQKGREALAAGNPTEAIERFESAIRLDPVSGQSLSMLQEARAAVERARDSARLVAEAQSAAGNGDAAAAARLARQALGISPGDPAAQQILQRAEAALAEEAGRARLSDALSRVRRLIEIRSWNEASALLSGLAQDFPGTPEISTLAEEVRAGQWKDEREQQLSYGLSEARKNIQQGDLAAALAGLEDLGSRFGESKDVESLLRFVRSEIAEQRHRATVERSIEQARALAARHDLKGAWKVLQDGLSEYPEDAGLQQELRAVLAEQKTIDARNALGQAVSEAGKLRAARKLDEALGALDRFVDVHGADPAIETLRDAILNDQETARRAAELRDFIRRANDLLAQGQPDAAATLLQAPPEHFKGHPEITRLLNAADLERRARDDRQAAIDDALSAAAKLRQQSKVDQALQVLDAFRSRYGDDPRIEEARRALDRARQEIQQAATDLAQRATDLIAWDPAGATAILGNAPSALREHPAVQAAGIAAAKAEQEKRAREEAAELIGKARGLFQESAFTQALSLLDEGLVRFPGHAEIGRLRAEVSSAIDQLRRGEQRQSILTEVRNLLEQHRYEQAELAVAGVLAGNPDDEVFQRLRRDVETRKKFWIAERADQEVRETLARAREVLSERPSEAAALLDGLSRKFPDRTEVSALLAEARDAVARQERRELIQDAERLCQRQDFKTALAKLAQVRQDPNGEIASAIDRVKSLREEAATQRVAEVIQAARNLRDRDPQGAMRLLEGLPEPLRIRPEVTPEIQACRTAITKAERSAAILDVEQLFASGKVRKARTRHKEIIARFGADPEIDALLDRIEQAERARKAPAAEAPKRKLIYVATGVAAVAIVVVGVWAISNRTPVSGPVPESQGNQSSAEPRAVNSPPPVPPPSSPSIAKEPVVAPLASGPQPKGPVAAPANPAPSAQPTRQEPKQVTPSKAEPEPPRQNNDKGETTVAVLPPQLPAAAPAPPINTPAPPAVTPLPNATQPVIPTPTQPTAPKSQPPSEVPAIEQVLADFGAAFTRKDIKVVSDLWPTMPNLGEYKKYFADKNYVVSRYALEPQDPPVIQGERAQVNVRLTANISFQRGGGVSNPAPSSKTVLLEKRAGRWVITAIR
ncbi:MAG: protein kinase [Acidobacteriia bacterium]|nr:protein kinase [Terriglobia bacterium]